MNLESWVKNPRQRTSLLGGVGAVAFLAMAWFTLRPLLTQKSAAAHELAAIEEKIRSADLLMKQETRLREDLAYQLNVLPLSFSYGLYQVLAMFLCGGTLVLERSFAYLHPILQRMADAFPGIDIRRGGK